MTCARAPSDTKTARLPMKDFYGEEMVAIVCGSVRAEQKFDSLDALVAQIRQDIAISEQQLAKPECQALRSDKHFD